MRDKNKENTISTTEKIVQYSSILVVFSVSMYRIISLKINGMETSIKVTIWFKINTLTNLHLYQESIILSKAYLLKFLFAFHLCSIMYFWYLDDSLFDIVPSSSKDNSPL